MNKTELIAKMSETADLNKAQAERALNALTENLTDALSQGESVNLIGFGTFQVKERSERSGRNPQTGEAMTIPASKLASFKPGKALKEAVNG